MFQIASLVLGLLQLDQGPPTVSLCEITLAPQRWHRKIIKTSGMFACDEHGCDLTDRSCEERLKAVEGKWLPGLEFRSVFSGKETLLAPVAFRSDIGVLEAVAGVQRSLASKNKECAVAIRVWLEGEVQAPSHYPIWKFDGLNLPVGIGHLGRYRGMLVARRVDRVEVVVGDCR